jgi:hypothetical protein
MTTQHRGKLSRDSESIYTKAWEGDAVELPGGQPHGRQRLNS